VVDNQISALFNLTRELRGNNEQVASNKINRKDIKKLAKENVEAPIPGKILTIECKVGGDVQEGDIICYIESMKMENPIVAPVAGKIAELKIAEGQVVETGNLICIIES